MEIESNTKWNAVKYILIALFPVLSLYRFVPLLDIGYFVLMLIIMIEIIEKKLIVDINLEILFVMAVLAVINLLVGVLKYPDSVNTVNNSLGMIIFTFLAIFLCFPGNIDKEKLYNACKIVGILATLFVVCQYVAFNYFDIVIKGQIPFLTPSEPAFISIEYGRPTSFFYEPAHYIIYIAPIYAMSIIKKEYWIALVFFVGAFLSTSITGIVLFLAIPIIIIMKKSKSVIYLIIFIIITIMIFYYLPDSYDQYLSKLSLDNLMGNVRVFGTLGLFKYFSMPEWFFGVGINRLVEFLSGTSVLFERNYANSLIFLVFSFGIVGSLFWVYLCVILYKKIEASYKVMWYILLFIFVSDQVLFNRNLLYLLIWIYAVSQVPEDQLNESFSGPVGRVL